MNENMEHNEIDHIFREAFDKFETPYQETYWSTMRDNLDKSMPLKKAAPWKWLLPLLIVGLSAGGILLWPSSSEETSTVTPSEPTVKEQAFEQDQQTVSQETGTADPDTRTAVTPQVVIHNSPADGENRTLSYNKNEIKQASRDNTRINRSLPSLPSETKENAAKNNTSKEQLAVKTNTDQPTASQENDGNNTIEPNKSLETDKNDLPTTAPKQIEVPNTDLVQKDEAAKETEVLKPASPNKAAQGTDATGSNVVAVANLDLHFLGGPSLGNAFSSDGGRQDKVVNYQAGLGFGYHFNKKLSLNIDLLYQTRNGHTLVRRVASDEYFLYKKSQTFTLTTSKSDYLVVPVYLKYNISSRHSVTGGLYTNFLLNSYNKTENATTTMWGSSSGVTEDKVNYGAWEVINYGWTINYEYALLKNIGIGLGYSQGMKDATVNSFYKNSRNDLYKDLQFTLKYYWK